MRLQQCYHTSQVGCSLDMWIDLLASHLQTGDPSKASNLFELPVAPQLDGTSRPQRVRNKAQETCGLSSVPCILRRYALCWGANPRKASCTLGQHSTPSTSHSTSRPVHDSINANTTVKYSLSFQSWNMEPTLQICGHTLELGSTPGSVIH